jgi:AbrB family looped-hinge helix DNA binding protein
MKIGERGQITIPKELRDKHGLHPSAEVDFVEVGGELVLRKVVRDQPSPVRRWIGFLMGQPEDVDQFIEDIRGR